MKKNKKIKTVESLKRSKKLLNRTLLVLIAVLTVTVLAAVTVSVLTYRDIIKFPALNSVFLSMGVKSESDDIGDDGENNKDETKGDNVLNETSSVTEGTEAVINPTDNSNIPQADSQDAQTYYGENSTVAAAVKADTAETVTSEKETYDLLRERGFTQVSITSEYEMDGTYYEAKAISSTSGKKHPIYQAIYVSSSNEIWSLFVINGAVLANPVSYNMQSKLGVQTIISERDTIMSYDSTSNQFFETVPKSTALNVKKVEKIDAQTLDALTVQAISG